MSGVTSLHALSMLPSSTLPLKNMLLSRFKGQSVKSVQTPALFIDRAIFTKNCSNMHQRVKTWGVKFRAHVKTHKTAEGTRIQLRSDVLASSAIVVSTLAEAWQVLNSELVTAGVVDDYTIQILYGLPVGPTKIAELAEMIRSLKGKATIRIMIDNIHQLRALEAFGGKWSAFVKMDHGGKRAGLPLKSEALRELITAILASDSVHIHGFYCHAGDSYASTTPHQAASFLTAEMQTANDAAGLARSILDSRPELKPKYLLPFVLSVGSTPTAHATSLIDDQDRAKPLAKELTHGELEIHAGNYPVCDLQQIHTGLVRVEDVAHRVLASVLSYYPGRAEDGTDEALCDAGAIAMSKDSGPSGGYGDVVPWLSNYSAPLGELDEPPRCEWRLGRCSQEHGILTRTQSAGRGAELIPGQHLWIIGQHACLTMAAHPWYYILDSSVDGGLETIQDVWVPWKGW
ncbi:hypothetical protein FRC17_000895 [Serendipita sp. 399]|nr:hypothetical protein FRC17_000895 [Serendipita sp. 399]